MADDGADGDPPASKKKKDETAKKSFKIVGKWNEAWLKNPGFSCFSENKADKWAYCNLCRKVLKPKLDLLHRHLTSENHIQNTPKVNQPKMATFLDVESSKAKDTKEKEIKLAMYATVHTSLNAIDHLSDIIHESYDSNVSIKRTKATAICKNVVSASMKAGLKQSLKDQPFSILIDESTDLVCNKVLAIIVRLVNT